MKLGLGNNIMEEGGITIRTNMGVHHTETETLDTTNLEVELDPLATGLVRAMVAEVQVAMVMIGGAIIVEEIVAKVVVLEMAAPQEVRRRGVQISRLRSLLLCRHHEWRISCFRRVSTQPHR